TGGRASAGLAVRRPVQRTVHLRAGVVAVAGVGGGAGDPRGHRHARYRPVRPVGGGASTRSLLGRVESGGDGAGAGPGSGSARPRPGAAGAASGWSVAGGAGQLESLGGGAGETGPGSVC